MGPFEVRKGGADQSPQRARRQWIGADDSVTGQRASTIGKPPGLICEAGVERRRDNEQRRRCHEPRERTWRDGSGDPTPQGPQHTESERRNEQTRISAEPAKTAQGAGLEPGSEAT